MGCANNHPRTGSEEGETRLFNSQIIAMVSEREHQGLFLVGFLVVVIVNNVFVMNSHKIIEEIQHPR